MAKNETMKVMIARIDERTKILPSMEKHLTELNDAISETNIKLAKTDAIARAGKEKAENNRRYIDRATIALMVAGVTVVGTVIAILVSI